MKNLWSDSDARAAVAHHAAKGIGEDLALRVYTTRLLGGEPRLVLHGGGNTSVKTTVADVTGAPVDVLCVKGSGWDMRTIEAPGLPAVRLQPLGVPYLKLVGGALLLWIGIKLVLDEEEEAKIKAHDNIWAAIWTIIVADAVMSLDNAIAIAAAAKGDFTLIVTGLVISIPIIVFGATLISRVLDRFPWLGLVGAALIGWIAGEVIAGEGRIDRIDANGQLVAFVRPGTIADWLDHAIPYAETISAALGAGLVVLVGLLIARLRSGQAEKG
jgi:YjbE family integral membrane protein